MKSLTSFSLRKFCALTILLCASWLQAADSAPEPSKAENAIESLDVSRDGGSVVVKLGLSQAMDRAPTAFTVATPPRLVLDFSGLTNRLGRNSQIFNEGDLKSANVVQAGDRTRVVLNLANMVSYETSAEGKNLSIKLTPMKVMATGSPLVSKFAETKDSDAAHQVKGINFRRGSNGEGRIVVDLSDGNTGIDIRQQGGNLVVDFLKASLPNELRRRLDVNDFGTAVTSVEALAQGENTRLIVSPKGQWEHNAYQSDSQFVLEIKTLVDDPTRLNRGNRLGYQGEKLSLNFQNIPIREVLAVVADFSGFNIVISDSVNGSITLVLKDVPWDQALDIILSQKGLDMRKNGNVILIAPRDELLTKEKLELESKQQISDLEALRTETIQINYHKAKAIFDFFKLKDQTLMSKRGSVIVDERSNKIFVTDVPGRLADVMRLIKEIDIPTRQVMIEARVVIAGDTFFKSLGARLGFSGGFSGGPLSTLPNGTTTTNAATGAISGSVNNPGTILNSINTAPAYFPTTFLGGSLNLTGYQSGQLSTTPTLADALNVNLPASTAFGTPGQFAMSLYAAGMSRFIDLEISALEADQKGKVVSSPRILTANQVEALIEQGTEIPYQQATSSGATSVAFRKANLSLKVKPQILPDGTVQMEIEVNKDSVGAAVSAGIAINTKHVKTNVQVENGGTVVIGGIYEETTSNNVTKVPLLGDLPFVGNLFKNRTRQDDKAEVLVFISPKIVAETLSLR